LAATLHGNQHERENMNEDTMAHKTRNSFPETQFTLRQRVQNRLDRDVEGSFMTYNGTAAHLTPLAAQCGGRNLSIRSFAPGMIPETPKPSPSTQDIPVEGAISPLLIPERMASPGPSRLRETTIAEFEKTFKSTNAEPNFPEHRALPYRPSPVAGPSDGSSSTGRKINKGKFSDGHQEEKVRKENGNDEDQEKIKVSGLNVFFDHALRRFHGGRISRPDRSDTSNETSRANPERDCRSSGRVKRYDPILAQALLAHERKAASTGNFGGPSRTSDLSSLSYYPSIMKGRSGRSRQMECFPGSDEFPYSSSDAMQFTIVNTVDPITSDWAPNRISIKSPEGGKLDIALRRTVRVPDDGRSHDLPPNLGNFPIYEVNAYKERLPVPVVQKGGYFMPIHG
jgi:hypothetical protein